MDHNKPHCSSNLYLSEGVWTSGATYTVNNSPEFDSYHGGWTTLMCRLIIGTPSSDGITDVATPVFDLSIVTHGVSTAVLLGEQQPGV